MRPSRVEERAFDGGECAGGGGMTDTATLDRVYMTLGGLQADAKSVDSKMRAGIEYAIERMEAALIEALQSNKY